MDKDLIERLAREADLVGEGYPDGSLHVSIPETEPIERGCTPIQFEFPISLQRFAALVAEECAKLCEATQKEKHRDAEHGVSYGYYPTCADFTGAIRERFK